ncbi:hypothetical protein AVEN_82794-1 [Araneus ventricosus]|uniref:Uncharacterized protein n=1 Tax=Araneus ventricosus TaxID=182803 RepID=A0A4Y2DCD1_ARAVE|nr:hypothetical protein AVEN_82794-1 [Araneus ventricosus]
MLAAKEAKSLTFDLTSLHKIADQKIFLCTEEKGLQRTTKFDFEVAGVDQLNKFGETIVISSQKETEKEAYLQNVINIAVVSG